MLYQGTTLTVTEMEPGLAELCFDAPGAPVNTLGQRALQELDEALRLLSTRDDLRGLLLTSGKDGFIAGADVTEFTALFEAPEEQLTAQLQRANTIVDALQDLPLPTVAAINGAALGGGFEICLAADFRVAADHAVLGLPEVKLGIHPGFGGTVRLPRLIGCDNANEWISGGAEKKAAQALADGAVDAVVEPARLRDAALDLLGRCIGGEFDWKARRHEKNAPVQLNDIERMMAFTTAKALVAAKAGPHLPAPLGAVKTMEKSAGLERAQALEIETRSFVKLAKTPQAAALVGLFINNQVLAKANRRFEGQAQRVRRAGVLGAGIMGGGIAYQSALRGVPVLMKDVAEQGLEAGINEASKQLLGRVERGRMSAAEMAAVLGRIRPTLDYQGFSTLDITVEAVVENPAVKKKVLAECEAQLPENAVLASNTSTISISELATALSRPAQFCGMHFFNPVHRMPLVEVIRGRATSDATLATVVGYAKAMGKTPIVVNDCAGFYVNRVLFPYFMGFDLLLRDGADFRRIDRVMEQFGWPMGPAFLLDVVGIDTASHTTPVMAAAYPQRMAFADKPLHTQFAEQKRFGQKNGRGFYQHGLDRKGKPQKSDDPEALALVAAYQQQHRSVASKAEWSDEEIIARLMVPMCNEVVRCLDEHIVASPAEADMGLVLGIGFPPFRGGALRYIDQMGARQFCETADRYAALGEIYQPSATLRQMAAQQSRFFGPKEVQS